MNGQTQTRRIEIVHCLILGLSMFLVGLYFGTSLPAGVDLVVLQTGLIGILGFLGLTQVRIAVDPKQKSNLVESGISRSRQVERRLDRHIAPRAIQRIDRGRQESRPVSVRKSSRTVGTVSAVTERESVSILD
ncbi:MAG: hypothetical protein HQ518_17040 [Rhodopirellula sp.]|nr:hypothetical protein [Rhodopirellula sp.]